MTVYAARKIGTELYINKEGLGFVGISGAAKLNSEKVIRNKIRSLVRHRGESLAVTVNSFEIVSLELQETGVISY